MIETKIQPKIGDTFVYGGAKHTIVDIVCRLGDNKIVVTKRTIVLLGTEATIGKILHWCYDGVCEIMSNQDYYS